MTYWRSKEQMRTVRRVRKYWRRAGFPLKVHLTQGRREVGSAKSRARKRYYREHRLSREKTDDSTQS